jgi:hypothetical protein
MARSYATGMHESEASATTANFKSSLKSDLQQIEKREMGPDPSEY